MKKLLFISRYEDSLTKILSDGVTKKLKIEMETLSQMGYEVDYIVCRRGKCFLRESGVDKYICDVAEHFLMMKKIYKYLKNTDIQHYDYIYCRYDHVSFSMISFFRKMRKRGTYIIAELPTYSSKWEPNSSLRVIVGFLVKRLMNISLNLNINVFVTFSEHKKIWGVPTIQIENFVDVSTIPMREVTPDYTGDIHLIGVAMMTPSHGYDRVIRGLYDYYQKNNTKNVFFDIVGEGSAKVSLHELTKSLGLEKYVLFHGIKGGGDLSLLFNRANIAIASLAIFRKGCSKASELKIREYCARGIPFIYSANEPILNACNFALKIPHNDSAVKIEEVLSHFKNLMVSSEEMRQFAYNNCSCAVQFEKLRSKKILV